MIILNFIGWNKKLRILTGIDEKETVLICISYRAHYLKYRDFKVIC